MNARDTKHEARILVMAMMAVSAAVAQAMPTQQELKKAQPLVAELMSPLMDDFRAKKKTAEEVADMAVKYAGEAETEAAKFMLYRGSIPYYVRGEAYDKAADAVEQLKANVKDVPPSVIEEIISKATVRATAKKAPRLFELYRRAKAQSVAEKDIETFRAKLKKNPDSQPNTRNLAEALATSGDWDAALKEFAKLRDKAAQMAKAEQDGSAKSTELGEFWWGYRPTYENADDTFEMRAAIHYRKALDAGEITGLKKNIVEQRIAKYGDALAMAARTAAAVQASDLGWIRTDGGSPFKIKGNVATLDLGAAYGTLEFVRCPAGEVNLVLDDDGRTKQMRISRPFWMSRTPLTCKQVKVAPGVSSAGKEYEYADLSRRRTDQVVACLNSTLGKHLASGAVFRLPTLAETEYAFHANTQDRNDPYYDLTRGHGKDDVGQKIYRDDVRQNQPNAWGMHGFSRVRILDTFCAEQLIPAGQSDEKRKTEGKGFIAKGIVSEPDMAVDPLYWTEKGNPLSACRFLSSCHWSVSSDRERDWIRGFRLVIGPDLVSEWKAKNAKK